MLALRKAFIAVLKQRRDPRYIFVLFGALVVFTICFLQVRSAGMFDSLEVPVFKYFNSLPHALYDVMYAITQLGGLGSVIIWVGLAWYLVNKRAAVTVAGTGILAWTLAKVAKVIAHRGRPGELLHHIHLFDGEKLSGYGFPSGHSTFVAACVTVLYYQVAPKYRKYLLLAALLVGISRMYLGAHFPLDVVGGWALGAFIGSLVIMAIGVSNKGLSPAKLKRFLNKKGMQIRHLSYADLDARGSRPFFFETEDGKKYFGKAFGKQEHAADWLFKIFRFFRYKNLQAEEPHINSRRNVEIEAFAMLWAKQAGVRAAHVTDIVRYGSYWISIQERVAGKQLSEHGHLLQKSLEDTWRQVKRLHDANIAHRDLRAANILVDKQGRAYLIDFGFAEISASKQRLHMDNAELLMSMTLVVGAKRTVAAAKKVLGEGALQSALPFLQKAVFSGATTKLLKSNKNLLKDLKETIKSELKLDDDVDDADVVRFNRRKVINFIIFAVFVYVLAPQLGIFKDAVEHIHIASFVWFIPLVVAALLTYVLTGITYTSLASVPLKIRETSLVQLAASFVSKVAPGGIGGSTLNAKYFLKAGLDPLETSAVIAGQAFIGFVMFSIPMGIFLVLNGTNILHLIKAPIPPKYLLLIGVALVISGVILAMIPRFRTMVLTKIRGLVEGLRNNVTSPRELALAAASSLGVTAAYVFCLYASLQAIGVHMGVMVVILVYALAVLAKSAIPAPGGLGPVEAAMVAALISFGLDKGGAISGVLIYRLATFWVPIPFSVLAYRYINRKKLV